jgi:opacity protein-like surface antigen
MRRTTKHIQGFKHFSFCSKSSNYIHSYCLVFALILFLIPVINAQSEEKKNTLFEFQNEKLSAVLTKLSEAEKLNFTYDANDSVFEKRINYSSDGESVQKILDNILSNTGIKHKQIGNQIVLYRVAAEQQVVKQEPVNPPVTTVVLNEEPVVKVDYKLDTIVLYDTLLRIDTIRKTDTVYIEKEKPKKISPSKIKDIPVDFFQPGNQRDKGWALGVFAAPIMSDFSLVNGENSFSLRSFSLGVDAIKLLKRWNITFGLRLTHFNQKFNQHFIEQQGGFYNTDTIDTYYTVIESDTSWYFVTDSSWVPFESREYSYKQSNSLGYLEFNLSATYDLFQGQKIRFYLKAGGQLNLLIYHNGIAVPDINHAEGINFNELQFNTTNYSVLAGLGIKYKIADKMDLNSELYYSRYLNALVQDFPVNTQINAIGLKVGLVFYF